MLLNWPIFSIINQVKTSQVPAMVVTFLYSINFANQQAFRVSADLSSFKLISAKRSAWLYSAFQQLACSLSQPQLGS